MVVNGSLGPSSSSLDESITSSSLFCEVERMDTDGFWTAAETSFPPPTFTSAAAVLADGEAIDPSSFSGSVAAFDDDGKLKRDDKDDW